jgi:flagellar hook-associated protein 2
LAGNPDGVEKFFVGDGYSTGFVNAVKREISNLLNPAVGPLTNRSKGLKEKIDQFDKRIEQQEKQLGKKEEMLRAKFSRLEETMSKLKAQGSQVGAMGGGGNLMGSSGGG